MNIETWVILIAAIGAGIVVALAVMRRAAATGPGKKSRHSGSEPPPVVVTRNEPSKRNKLYLGVTVMPGVKSCRAAQQISGKRYLTHVAPHFPLRGCDVSECQCKMMPEDDRRAGFDRRGDSFSAFGDFNPHEYKRRRGTGPDRRNK